MEYHWGVLCNYWVKMCSLKSGVRGFGGKLVINHLKKMLPLQAETINEFEFSRHCRSGIHQAFAYFLNWLPTPIRVGFLIVAFYLFFYKCKIQWLLSSAITGAIFTEDQKDSSTELAFKYAVYRINKNKEFLPNTTLVYDIQYVPRDDSFRTSKKGKM